MKKLFSTRRWARALELRRDKFERRRRKGRHRSLKTLRESIEEKQFQREARQREQPIPVIFEGKLDPMERGSATVANCEEIRHWLERGRPVFIDISGMTGFTLAGAMYLSASLEHSLEHPHPRTLVKGNMPSNGTIANEFFRTGFFDNLKVEGGGQLPSSHSAWERRQDKVVLADVAAQLVDFADRWVGLQPEQIRAISQNLVECMTNTINHATMQGEERTQPWIAGVWCNRDTAYFAFVDKGVGICGSAEAQSFLRSAGRTLRLYGSDRLLKTAFAGQMGSSTGQRGRGLGLPRMQRDAEAGILEDLYVRTGQAVGRIDKMTFHREKETLRGTVIAWMAVGTKGRA